MEEPRARRRMLILNSCRKWIGEAAHSFDLARELRRRGHYVILGVRKGFELEEAARSGDLPRLELNLPSAFSPRLDSADVAAVRRTVREERIGIVHCNRGKDHWVAAAALWGNRAVPLIRTRHVVTLARNHAFNRWLYGRATRALVCVSQRALDGMGRLLDAVPPARRRVIYSAVDGTRFHPGARSAGSRAIGGAGEGQLLVGLIGRYQNIKGQAVFLEAARRLAGEFPQMRFMAAGRGNPNKVRGFKRRIAAAGLEERFVALPQLDDLPPVMASLDIGVAASLGSEGSSRVSLEYMASGVPVVATTVGGIPELLRDGEFGQLVAPGDAEALAAAIARFAREPGMRKDYAARARRRVEEFHTYERWVEEMEEVYGRALEGK